MKTLEERIKRAATKKEKSLNVEGYLNRLMDTELLFALADEFAACYPKQKITRVLTVESAGIGLAVATAQRLSAGALYARKVGNHLEKDAFVAEVAGGTKRISLPRKLLSSQDTVLIVDDFIGAGNVTRALVELVRQSGAKLIGVCVAINRAYLGGGKSLAEQGISLYASTAILSESADGIVFAAREE